jgi:hypothetical protein
VKFLELSGVGRVMADGTDENGAHAARMDERVAWESVERTAPRVCFPRAVCFLSVYIAFCRRGSYSALPRAEGFSCCSRPAEGRLLVPFVFPRPHIPWEWTALSLESNK